MPRMICAECEVDMIVGQVGILLEDMAYDPPMVMATASADTRVCPICGKEVIWGMGLFEHDREKIEENSKNAKRIVRSFENYRMRNKYYSLRRANGKD